MQDEGESIRDRIAGFEPTLARYAALSGESVSYVGTQLRDLTDEVRALSDDRPATTRASQMVVDSFALRALAATAPPARILVVDGTDHAIGLAMAMLGFDVETVGTRPDVRGHPNLHTLQVEFHQLSPEFPFAAVCCPAGLPSDAAENADRWEADASALARIRTLLDEDGVVVLALPMRPAEGGDGTPHEKQRLDALLEGWRVVERLYVREVIPGTWMRTGEGEDGGLALVCASAAD